MLEALTEEQIDNLYHQVQEKMGELRAFQSGYMQRTPNMDENMNRLTIVWATLKTILEGGTLQIALNADESGEEDRVVEFDPKFRPDPNSTDPTQRGWWRGYRSRPSFAEQLGPLPDLPTKLEDAQRGQGKSFPIDSRFRHTLVFEEGEPGAY